LDHMAAAERAFRQSSAIVSAVPGDTALRRLEVAGPLGDFLFDTGRTSEGLRILRDARDTALATSGLLAEASIPGRTAMRYGRAQIAVGHVEQGLADLARARSLASARRGDPLIELNAQIADAQAVGLIEIGRFADAEAALKAATDLHSRAGELGTPWANRNIATRARLLLHMGRSAEASAVVDAFWDGPNLDAAARPRLDKMLLRSAVAMAQGNAIVSLAMTTRVRELIDTSANREFLKWQELRADRSAAEALRRLGKPADALTLSERAEQLAESLEDPSYSLDLASTRVALAETFLSLGQRERASTMLLSAQQILARHPQVGPQYSEALRAVKAALSQPPG
jgi:tetratricopeptide (TPR) repeat protein